jgi:uncharacterized protein YndB with AHSA1/START domain
MNAITASHSRIVTEATGSYILATVEIASPPERVFQALASREIVDWWVRPGVFDTTEWTGDVRVGGRWRSAGIARGEAYALEGEYLEVDPPRKLVHTWKRAGAPDKPTTVTYLLERLATGTRLTLRHSGFASPQAVGGISDGWETSFARLVEFLTSTRR